MNSMLQKILIPLSFVLGLVCYHVVKQPCHSFPNFKNKYQHESIFTPEKQFERQKATGKFPKCKPPESLILCYTDETLDHVLSNYATKKCAGMYFLTDYPSVAIANFGITAPQCAMKLEKVIAWGVKQIIAIGSGVALQHNLSTGNIIVCEKAIRDEGTSHHYLAYSKYAYPSKTLQAKLIDTLKSMRKPYILGTTWTTDGFYRATKPEVEQYQREGVLCAEMEAAAVLSVATYRGVDAVILLTPTDSYASLKWKKALHYKKKKKETLAMFIEIALNIAAGQNN